MLQLNESREEKVRVGGLGLLSRLDGARRLEEANSWNCQEAAWDGKRDWSERVDADTLARSVGRQGCGDLP